MSWLRGRLLHLVLQELSQELGKALAQAVRVIIGVELLLFRDASRILLVVVDLRLEVVGRDGLVVVRHVDGPVTVSTWAMATGETWITPSTSPPPSLRKTSHDDLARWWGSRARGWRRAAPSWRRATRNTVRVGACRRFQPFVFRP